MKISNTGTWGPNLYMPSTLSKVSVASFILQVTSGENVYHFQDLIGSQEIHFCNFSRYLNFLKPKPNYKLT